MQLKRRLTNDGEGKINREMREGREKNHGEEKSTERERDTWRERFQCSGKTLRLELRRRERLNKKRSISETTTPLELLFFSRASAKFSLTFSREKKNKKEAEERERRSRDE